MIRLVVYGFLVVGRVLGAVYYVESAPVSPFSCTATRPCRLQDLPTSFTTADSVVFLPATTGTSSTYASGSRTLSKPSVTLSPGVTFSAFTLNVASATSVTCTATVNFVSGSTLATAGVSTVSIDGCNFDNSQLVAQTGTTVAFKNAAVSGMTSTRKIQLQGTSVTVDTVSFSSGSTSVPALSVLTGSADSTFYINSVSMNGVTTTGANSAMLIQSTNGKPFTATVQGPTFASCTSGAALVELRIGAGGGQAGFNCDGDIDSLTATGGSVSQGIYYFNNNNAAATMSAVIAINSATNVNYNNGNVINLNANTGVIGVNGWQQNSNSFCGGTNEANLVACSGTQANANILLNGNTDGPTSVSGCGTTTMVNMGTTC